MGPSRLHPPTLLHLGSNNGSAREGHPARRRGPRATSQVQLAVEGSLCHPWLAGPLGTMVPSSWHERCVPLVREGQGVRPGAIPHAQEL